MVFARPSCQWHAIAVPIANVFRPISLKHCLIARLPYYPTKRIPPLILLSLLHHLERRASASRETTLNFRYHCPVVIGVYVWDYVFRPWNDE
jgi:hypothetical protein